MPRSPFDESKMTMLEKYNSNEKQQNSTNNINLIPHSLNSIANNKNTPMMESMNSHSNNIINNDNKSSDQTIHRGMLAAFTDKFRSKNNKNNETGTKVFFFLFFFCFLQKKLTNIYLFSYFVCFCVLCII